MKKKLILSLGLAALLTSCGYSEDYDEMEYLTGPDDSCADKCGVDQYCINGVCSNKQPGGNECYDHNHCQSGYCADFDRTAQDYIGVCKSYGGQSCRIDSDCIFGKCNKGICECTTHDGCEGQSLCDNGTCLPLLNCPTDESKKCILIHDSVPNTSWASGNGVSATEFDPYFGNMVTFKLPTQYAYSCGMLYNALIKQYLSSVASMGSQDLAKLLGELSLRTQPTCFSMELAKTADKDNKVYAALEYTFTPNEGIKSKLATDGADYNVYFSAVVSDSGLMGTDRFQMEIGHVKNGSFSSKAQVAFPTSSETLSMKLAKEGTNNYNVYFKGFSNTSLALDNLLSLYCNDDFIYIPKEVTNPGSNDNPEEDNDKPKEEQEIANAKRVPKYNQNIVGCKTVKFLLTSLKMYVQVVDNIPFANPQNPQKDERSKSEMRSSAK